MICDIECKLYGEMIFSILKSQFLSIIFVFRLKKTSEFDCAT
jgi:hypothetical protein